MSEPLRTIPAANPTLKQNQIMLVGRLDRCKKLDNFYDHIVTLPAADEFSKPSLVRLKSSAKVGEIGEMIKTPATWLGFPNTFELKTGTRAGEKVYDVTGYFQAVE